jgi:signal transduction histidine kinase
VSRPRVALIGERESVLRFHQTLVGQEGEQAVTLVAMAVPGLSAPGGYPLPAYAQWEEMIRDHAPDMVILLEAGPELKLDLRRTLPPEIELCERLPAEILSASLLSRPTAAGKSRARFQGRLEAIISHLPLPLVHSDIQGRLLYANRAALLSALHPRLSGKRIRMEGFNFLSCFPEIDREFRTHFLNDIGAALPELTPRLSKTMNVQIRDQQWAVTCLALPEKDDVWTLLWIMHSISSKEEQDRLNAALAMAGAISHELSQPLTAIINSAQILGNTAMDDGERIRRHVRIITSEGERVLALYQKLHNITKFKLTTYLDTQIFDLEKSADLDLTIREDSQEKP